MTTMTTTNLHDFGGAPYGNAVAYHGKVTVAADEDLDADNSDVLQLIHVPAGTELLSLVVVNGDLDSGTNLTAKIGWAYVDGVDVTATPQDDDAFAASGAWGQTAATTTYVLDTPVTVPKDVWIIITPTNTTNAENAAAVTVKGVLYGTNRGIK